MKRITIVALGLISAVVATSVSAASGNAAKGKEKSATCVACHGADGNSPTAMFPRIAGQHEDYLNQALKSYKNGTRKNEVMKGIVAPLSAQDMADLAAYFSSQKGLEIKR
ncbi:c-type cytochrome [Uliginosibacterium sp. H1]|uniref:c-type cytochrome n=1 Tax=Uliginosibacterium sp. H1 TaxID=3114757 RepID=UPI002E1924F6|nr:cytochrome c [Uliginosibacterium sp. H1]